MKKPNINPDDFYSNDERMPKDLKAELWDEIDAGLKPENSSWFSWKSFAFGFVSPVVLIFMIIGIGATCNEVTKSPEPPAYVGVSNAYVRAAVEFEKVLPQIRNRKREVRIDELMDEQFDQLDTINVVIGELKEEFTERNYSRIKAGRLKELYRVKLEIINKILELEESSYEK